MSDEKEKDFNTLVDEHMWNFKCSKLEAMKEVMRKHSEAHRRYIEQANEGR